MQEYSLYEQGGGIFSRPIVMQNANHAALCLVGYGAALPKLQAIYGYEGAQLVSYSNSLKRGKQGGIWGRKG